MTRFYGCLLSMALIFSSLGAMEQAPEPKLPAYKMEVTQETECAICYEKFGKEPYSQLPCGHAFHFECFKKNANTQVDIHTKEKGNRNTCPLCNHELSDKQLEELKAKPSGALEAETVAESSQEGMFSRFITGIKNISLTSPPTEITKALMNARQQLANAQEQIEHLSKEKTTLLRIKETLENTISKKIADFNRFRDLRPNSVLLEKLKEDLDYLAKEKQRLEQQVAGLQEQKRKADAEVVRVRNEISLLSATFEREKTKLQQELQRERTLKDQKSQKYFNQITRHDKLRKNVAFYAAIGSGILGGFFGYNYFSNSYYPKFATFIMASAAFLSTYLYGNSLADRYFRNDIDNYNRE